MISASVLTALRTTVEASLPDSCTIRRNTQTSDGAGGMTDSWANLATVACRVSPSGRAPEERVIAERIGSVGLWTVTLPALTEVTAKDRLLIGARQLEVIAVLAPRSWELCRRVVCSEVV